MTTSVKIKEMARSYGADLCGIAPVERFAKAPNGFHPFDIYSGTKSVIVIAVRESESPFYSRSAVPYTFATEMALQKVFSITFQLVIKLEERGITAIPIPTEPYEYWDADAKTGKGILSLKHAGQLAGLGVIGCNTLLVNRKFGNLIRLGAILTNEYLPGDPLEELSLDCEDCNLCVRSCPAGAIEDGCVSQSLCRPNSNVTNEKGYALYACNNCRKVCPHRAGIDGYKLEMPTELSNLIKVKNWV
jgi:epoxyqueuosine reductase QueG